MIQGPGYGLTFLYYFAITSVIALVLGHQSVGLGWQDPALYNIAVPFALLAGSIGAYVNQNILVTIPTPKKSATMQQLQAFLQTMGYERIEDNAAVTTYRRSGLAKLLSGRVFVQVEPWQILLSGRATVVHAIEKHLAD
jgi:hypothetical protein